MKTLLMVYLLALVAGVVWQNLVAVEAATPSNVRLIRVGNDHRDIGRRLEDRGYPVLTQ